MSFSWPIKSASRSEIGERKQNEDFFIEWRLKSRSTEAAHDGAMLAVADGMGGHHHGEIASSLACELLASYIRELGGRPQTTKSFCNSMEDIFQRINHEVIEQGTKDPSCKGMGTTLTSLVLFAKYALVSHVGDSRLYRLRATEFSQLSQDHTMVQSMLDKGILALDQVEKHPYRHVLTSVIGRDDKLMHVFTQIDEVVPGDRYLLCTDGLYNAISNERIHELLDFSSTPEDICDRLVNESLALNNSGDNITVVVAFVESGSD